MYCPDYNDLLDMHEAKQEKLLEGLPICHECGEPIQDEHCYEFNDELYCPDCVESNHRKWVEDIVSTNEDF